MVGDITEGAQVFNAMTTHFSFDGLNAGKAPGPVDAVVHFAAVPRILINPDDETLRVNVMGTHNVIEAAMKLGIRKVVIASSETTYGVCFAEGEKDFHAFPLEEDYDVDPMDSYGLSKLVNEQTARAFAAQCGQRHDHGRPAHGRVSGALVPDGSRDTAAPRQRGAALQPEGARGARLQGTAQRGEGARVSCALAGRLIQLEPVIKTSDQSETRTLEGVPCPTH